MSCFLQQTVVQGSGLLLGPLAEGRGRGGLVRPLSRAAGARAPADLGSAAVRRDAPPAAGPRPASEGPFAAGASAAPTGTRAPEREPRDLPGALPDAPAASAPPMRAGPFASTSAAALSAPVAAVATAPHALRSSAAPGAHAATRTASDHSAEEDGEDTRSPPPPSPRDLPPSTRPSDDDDDAPAAATAGASSVRESLSPDFDLREVRQDASPARPSSDAGAELARAADPASPLLGDAGATGASDVGARSRSSSVLSYYDLGGEPDLPPRRNAPTEPRITVLAADVEELLDEIQRVPPARPGQTAGPLARVTPRPDGGFPAAHIAHPRITFLNIKDSQRRDWSAHPGPKALVQFGGHGALDDAFNANLGLLSSATSELHAFLGSDAARITAPLPKDAPTGPNQAPFFALIHDLSPVELGRVLSQRVIATPRVTMMVTEYGVPMPVLLGVLTGFRSSNEDDIYLLVRDRLEDLLPFIMTKAYENPAVAGAISLQAFADGILASVRVAHLPMRGAGGAADPHFYVYASLPLTRFTSFREVQLRLAQADWGHSFAGSGIFSILEDPFCSFCHGADHPRGLCPLLAVPGLVLPVDPLPPRTPVNHKRRAGEPAGGERRKFARNY